MENELRARPGRHTPMKAIEKPPRWREDVSRFPPPRLSIPFDGVVSMLAG